MLFGEQWILIFNGFSGVYSSVLISIIDSVSILVVSCIDRNGEVFMVILVKVFIS